MDNLIKISNAIDLIKTRMVILKMGLCLQLN